MDKIKFSFIVCVFTLFQSFYFSSLIAKAQTPAKDKILSYNIRTDAARIFVFPGTSDPDGDKQARVYYDRIGKILNFDFNTSTLDTLLEYMGYSKSITISAGTVFEGLTAEMIEKLPSNVLMPRNISEFETLSNVDEVIDSEAFRNVLKLENFTDDNVLVSRFFAPKIATYYDSENSSRPIERGEITPGWRKLVRLKPLPGSKADQSDEVNHLYLLFNIKEEDPKKNPFENASGNNQIIITPKNPERADKAYFGVYLGGDDGYEVGTFLNADFDLPGHVADQVKVPGAEDSKYYIPVACAHCHGHSQGTEDGRPIDPVSGLPTDNLASGTYNFAKPNYLDTDQWYDWMKYDFPQIATSQHDVIFDGGKDHTSTEYKRAFDIIRRINKDIADETAKAERSLGIKSFQTLAAEKWLELHKTSDLHKDIRLRSIGNRVWDTANPDELELLDLLNNHCFRCHSSVKYNIFDRERITKDGFNFDMAGQMSSKVKVTDEDGNTVELSGFRMPQGRVLKDDVRNRMIELLEGLKE